MFTTAKKCLSFSIKFTNLKKYSRLQKLRFFIINVRVFQKVQNWKKGSCSPKPVQFGKCSCF